MDWNTVVSPSPQPQSTRHVVDNAGHTLPASQSSPGYNTAGDILVRNYLAPPWCTGEPGSSTCQPMNSAPSAGFGGTLPPAPFLYVRDVTTGCPYSLSFVETYLLNDSATQTGPPLNEAIVAVGSDPSQNQRYHTYWLDYNQQQDHISYISVTPQACYANGSIAPGDLPANKVAWVRRSEWVSKPGPDDGYIAGIISSSDISTMEGSGEGIRMRFQLPTRPDTPCVPTSGCELSGSEQLRYWSISFVQESSSGSNDLIWSPDIGTGNGQTIISIADEAFVPDSGGYVNLIVGVGVNPRSPVPSWLTSGATGVVSGVAPVAIEYKNSGGNDVWAYSLVQDSGGYYVLDLSQFVRAGRTTTLSGTTPFNPAADLQILIRETVSCPVGSSLYTTPAA